MKNCTEAIHQNDDVIQSRIIDMAAMTCISNNCIELLFFFNFDVMYIKLPLC